MLERAKDFVLRAPVALTLPQNTTVRRQTLPPVQRDIALSTSGTQPALPQSWHPKLTPYRLTVIATALALGTAKAITADYKSSSTSTTLEWILGVGAFLVVHYTGVYDSSHRAHEISRLSWIFTKDCMEFIWALFEYMAIPRPKYYSEERQPSTSMTTNPTYPPITFYRILVSSTIILCGTVKAVTAFLGIRIATNWVDWLLGALFMTALYILGLYENSSSELWPGFFIVNRARPLRVAGQLMLYVLCALLCLMWSSFFVYQTHTVWTDPKLDHGLSDGNDNPPNRVSERLYHHSVKGVLCLILMGIASVGIPFFVLSISSVKGTFGGSISGVQIRGSEKMLFVVNRFISGLYAVGEIFGLPLRERWKIFSRPLSRVLVHVVLHVLTITISLLFAEMMAGLFLTEYLPLWKEANGFFIFASLTALLAGIGAMALGCVLGAVAAFGSLLSPIYVYRATGVFQDSLWMAKVY